MALAIPTIGTVRLMMALGEERTTGVPPTVGRDENWATLTTSKPSTLPTTSATRALIVSVILVVTPTAVVLANGSERPTSMALPVPLVERRLPAVMSVPLRSSFAVHVTLVSELGTVSRRWPSMMLVRGTSAVTT